MILTVIFLVLAIISLVSLAGLILLSPLYIAAHVMKKTKRGICLFMKKTLVVLMVSMIFNICLVTFSQLLANTPDIKSENGISELIQLKFNGRKQWISIRGYDKNAPVLLFLAGGPGGTQMAAVRHELGELEKHFVVVNWDQPGSGKSYFAEKTKEITVETYISDGYALTEYLKERFNKEKIFLIGESWGSALGIFLIEKYPESYHAFIGTGQMVDFKETEIIDYNKAMEIARLKGDKGILKKLEKNGPPPYYGKSVTWKSAVYLNYLSKYMAHNPNINNPGYSTIRDVCSPEYGLIDKVNFFKGIIYTFNDVYQKLYDIDLREDYNKLDVPVYFFIGRHDVNAPTSLVEEYATVLDAPHKEIIWFEHSGHSPWINESDKFVKEVIKCFLQNT